MPYDEALQVQRDLVVAKQEGAVPDTLLLVEHPDVITLGRSARRENLLAPGDIPVFDIERGGDVTYHGPGQLVAYPIFLLRDDERDLHKYLRGLEEAVIQTLSDFRLLGARQPGKTGVWTTDEDRPRKLASIGVAVRKWVTLHGLALNVSTRLERFAAIHPCGFDSSVMTSMARELGHDVSMPAVKASLARRLGEIFHRDGLTIATPSTLLGR